MQQLLGTNHGDPGDIQARVAENGCAPSKEDGAAKRPRLKTIDRNQMCICPVDVDRLIDEDHPARLIWEFVGELDLSRFHAEIRSFEGEAGRSAFDPQLLISLWLYAYSQGVGTAREISRLCDYHPGFQWLTGMQAINYHTLSDFRISHKEELDDLFKQILAVLDSQGIIDLTRVFHDGSKFQANAASSSFHRRDTIAASLQLAEIAIAELENEDTQQQSRRAQAVRRSAANKRKKSLQKALEEFNSLPPTTTRKHTTRVSQTDPDARKMVGEGGRYVPAYNAQITTEAANGFIVAAQISQSSSDFEELIPAISKVTENTGMTPKQVVVDSGFASKKNIVRSSKLGVEMIGPLLRQSSNVEQLEKRGIDPNFGKEAFRFDPQKNHYVCPAGKVLSFVSSRNGKASIEHLYRATALDCRNCLFKEKCCGTMKRPQRRLIRIEDLPEVASFKERMDTEQAKNIYKQRAQFAEFPIAWIKEKFGLRKFHLRGKDKTLMELLWVSVTYNILGFIRIRRCAH